MNTEMKEYLGMECLVIIGDDEIPSYVVHVDRDKGITLHEIENDEEITCLNKVELINFIEVENKENFYNEIFDGLLKQIESGKVTGYVFNTMGIIPDNGRGKMQSCSFK